MSSEPTYTSKNSFEGCDVVLCPKCQRLDYERPHPLDNGGKYAWRCRGCGSIVEGDEIHLLQDTAYFKDKNAI
ncbi:hypothetical protein phiOC_p249 [Ochrobactrum phage vB_OspM_OC]|nr:hypothetical protein phiOC_p249 [Ochrobactrum phage vB_OspM_OC]